MKGYEYQRRRDHWADGAIMVLTWFLLFVIGVAVGLVIGYARWKGAETP